MRPVRLLIALCLSLATASIAQADDDKLRDLLQTPGVHAIMRHALAPGNSDPAGFRVDDCSTQRNLDGAGRAQSRAIGAALRDLGAAFDQVRTSQWCRCKETAALLDLGEPVEDPVLNSFFDDRSTSGVQTDALEAFLRALPMDRRVMIVTHQVNILALTGRSTGSGEVFFISVGTDGEISVVGELAIQP